ncbi:MAG: family 10 glycosylhydrolase, partial [Candidatus Eisenbacteria bacterium]|nr:family 10 glycosylhydrolase [Candidatus Eisenbacteria bacterium]
MPAWLAGLLAAALILCGTRAQAQVADSAAALAAAPEQAARAIDYLWVLRNSLVEPADIPRVVARAKAMGVRGILVQVVGRGDAWYRSDLLPAPEALRGSGRDPLGELLPLAHQAGLEVHAWFNCCLVWSGKQPPRDKRHVLNAHPE